MLALTSTLTNLSESMRLVIHNHIWNSENKSLELSMGSFAIIILMNIYYRSDHYNRVDKINMNNVKIVSPEKTGK
jgi:hypothetical protein